MLKSVIVGIVLLAMIAIGALPAAADSTLLAQETPPSDVSAADVERFANAYAAVRATQAEAEAQMVAAVEAEGLSLEEFNAIVTAQQDPAESEDIAPETAQQFENAIEQIVVIRDSAQSEMQAEIIAEGLELAEFNRILEQARENPNLQERIRSELEAE